MNPVHLRTLLAILDEGSFEGAAFRLGISPSAVSQRVKALEKETGRVVLRRTIPVTATQAGEVLVQAGRRLELLQAETSALLGEQLAAIPLAVAVNADSLSTWFRPMYAAVAAREGTTLSVTVEDESYNLALLQRGDVLGAIASTKETVPGCDAEFLGIMRYVAVANPRLLDRYTNNGEVDWQRLPVLRFGPRDHLQHKSLQSKLKGASSRQVPVHQVPSSEGFMEAARVGLGWALLPETQAVPLLESGQVVRLDDAHNEVSLYWHHWRLASESLEWLTKQVHSIAAEHLYQPPPSS